MIDSKKIATALSALSHPSRVDVFKCLLAHHPAGLNAGALSTHTGLAPSTLSHHLREMESGGVIKRSPHGKSTITTLDLQVLLEITTTLSQICCSIEQAPTDGSAQ